MALSKVHCRICNCEIDRNTQEQGIDWVMPSKNWYYHKSCYDDWEKKKSTIKTEDPNPTLWLDATWQYIKRKLNYKVDFNKFNSQWNNYITVKGYTPKGIFFSIKYAYEVKKCDIQKSQGGIGIVPYIYKDACTYWVNKNNKDAGICDRIQKQVIDSLQINSHNISKILQEVSPNVKTYDLDEIEDEE